MFCHSLVYVHQVGLTGQRPPAHIVSHVRQSSPFLLQSVARSHRAHVSCLRTILVQRDKSMSNHHQSTVNARADTSLHDKCNSPIRHQSAPPEFTPVSTLISKPSRVRLHRCFFQVQQFRHRSRSDTVTSLAKTPRSPNDRSTRSVIDSSSFAFRYSSSAHSLVPIRRMGSHSFVSFNNKSHCCPVRRNDPSSVCRLVGAEGVALCLS
jgi:hypothetical protein